MVSESNGHGVREHRSWCQRVTVMVLERKGWEDCEDQYHAME
jgi:hypothetical protein